MNVKSYIPLVMAAGLGLVAMVVARKTMSKGGNADAGSVTIVVASRPVGVGQELRAEDLQARKVSAAPPKAFRDPQDLVGRVTSSALAKGDAVVESLLAETGSGTGLQALVKQNFRAITVEVNEVTGVGGMLVPGSRVDVMAIVRDEKRPVPMAKTVLQNIRVSAVGRNLSPAAPAADGAPAPAANSVTLMVTPRQAEILQLVSQSGKPWLVLRNGKDEATADTQGVTLNELRGANDNAATATALAAANAASAQTRPAQPPADPFTAVAEAMPARPAPVAPKSAVRVVRVIRGGVESDVSIAVQATLPATMPVSPVVPERSRLWDFLAGESIKPQ